MVKRPIIVSILSILVIIGAIFEIVAGGMLLLVGITGVKSSTDIIAGISILLIILAIFFLILGIIGIFVGWGLWKGKNWARIAYIIIGTLGLLISLTSTIMSPTITSILTGIVGMVLPILIISYLLFSKKVKSYFR